MKKTTITALVALVALFTSTAFARGWKEAKIDIFGFGAPDTDTAWKTDQVSAYGGVDSPKFRNGYLPAGFTPRENPFYVALPYNDVTDPDKRRVKKIPWYDWEKTSSMKNTWVMILAKNTIVYAQVEETFTKKADDYAYVIGDSPHPKNSRGVGMQVSPAVADYLGLESGDLVRWMFVDSRNILPGPWNAIETTSDASW